jgi:hypothetical protein
MNSFINFLNKFNNEIGKYLLRIKIPYPNNLFQKIKKFFSGIWDSFLEKVHRFITEDNYAKNLFEDLINRIFSGATITLVIIISLLGFFYYQLDQRAFFEGKFSMDELQKIVGQRKPAFSTFYEREFYVPDVLVPVILKNRPDITRLYLDIKLRASNKLIKLYFTENNFVNLDKLIDRYLLTLSPIIPIFPLTNEGKDILRKKIKIETDLLLKELKIEGEIEEVIIQDILAA